MTASAAIWEALAAAAAELGRPFPIVGKLSKQERDRIARRINATCPKTRDPALFRQWLEERQQIFYALRLKT